MSKKIMLLNVRLSYEHIFQPSAMDDNSTPKYSAELLIPKDHPDLPAVKRAIFEAGAEKFPQAFADPLRSVWPMGYTCALKDADKDVDSSGVILAEKNPASKGCYILKASSTKRPVVLGRRKEALTEADGIIYSGCYINASVAAGGYVFGKVKKGVTCYLNGVQFVQDGERFGSDASSDFDELDGGAGDDDFML
jgi:hypothetical protein